MEHRETLADPTRARASLLSLSVAAGLVVLWTGVAPAPGAGASAHIPAAGADHGSTAHLQSFADVGTPWSSAAPDPDAFQVQVHGEGRPMILIPGLMSSGDVWDATVAHFSDRYQVHVLTLAGFAGVPPMQTEAFLPTQRDAILDYIRSEGLERPVIMGHSLGGFLAYWIAATDPDAVGPVVAVDGVPFLPALQQPGADESTMAERAEQMAAFYASMSEEQMRQQTRMATRAMVRDSSAVDTVVAWGARSHGATAGRAFAEMMTTDLRDEVADITSPLLLVMAGGGMSEATRERTRDAYAAQISAAPRGRLVVAADARHFVMLDAPDFLHDAVERFLAQAGDAGEAEASGAASARDVAGRGAAYP